MKAILTKIYISAPRQIQKLAVNASEREAVVTWESDGEDMAIDLRYGTLNLPFLASTKIVNQNAFCFFNLFPTN